MPFGMTITHFEEYAHDISRVYAAFERVKNKPPLCYSLDSLVQIRHILPERLQLTLDAADQHLIAVPPIRLLAAES